MIFTFMEMPPLEALKVEHDKSWETVRPDGAEPARGYPEDNRPLSGQR
jgi:hypothetical protein